MSSANLFRTTTAAAAIGLPLCLIFLTSCGGGSAGRSAPPGRKQAPPPAPEAVLVEVAAGQDIAPVASDYGAVVLESDREDGWYRLQAPAGTRAEALIKRLSGEPRLSAVAADEPLATPEAGGGSVTGDPIHLPFDFTQTRDASYRSIATDSAINGGAYSQVDLGATLSTAAGEGVIVAVLDTGVMASHPDLADSLLPGYNALKPGTPASDVADGTENAAWGHGTMVAGVIARLAPGAKILPVRVLNGDGQGSQLAVANGVNYAVSHGARVLNLSLGGVRKSGALAGALKKAIQAGVVVVAAAGNEGTDTLQYPAALPEVIGVAAVDSADRKAAFSDYGAMVSLTAPGVGIRSTYVNGGYATWSGTSFATPFVSAAAVLALSARPALSGSSVTQLLLGTARSLDAANPAYVGRLGRGMVDIEKAVNRGMVYSASAAPPRPEKVK